MNNVFYADNYLKQIETTIVDFFCVENKCYVVVNDSIFYPQGGGQKGDKGILIINNVEKQVLNSIKSFDERYKTLLIVENLENIEIGQVTCILDFDFRYRQMRLHSALHIHHCMIEEILKTIPNPIMSNIDDSVAFNKYEDDRITVDVMNRANELFKTFVSSNREINTYSDLKNEDYRYWKCDKYIIPCGGLHVNNTSLIGELHFDIKEKKGAITVKISL